MKKIMLASLLLYGSATHAAQANNQPYHLRFVQQLIHTTRLPVPLLHLIVCLATHERYRDVAQEISQHMPTKQLHAIHGLTTPQLNSVAMCADFIDISPEYHGQMNHYALTFQLDDPETPGYPVFRVCNPAEKSPLPGSMVHRLPMGLFVRADSNFGGFLFSPEHETGDVWKVGWAIAKYQQHEMARQEQEAKARAAQRGVKRKLEALTEDSGAGSGAAVSANQKLLTAPTDGEGDANMPPVADHAAAGAGATPDAGAGAGAHNGILRDAAGESHPKQARTS